MTQPVEPGNTFENEADGRQLAVAAVYKDPVTGATYIHNDLREVQAPWAERDYIPPPKVEESFGDVQSWVTFVKKYSNPSVALTTWNSHGLRAVIDFHTDSFQPARAQWIARQPFEFSLEWKAWMKLADRRLLSQKEAVQCLGDLADDIISPDASTVVGLLRKLRVTVNSQADTSFQPDGSTSVKFEKDAKVRSSNSGDATLPPELVVQIPVLKGEFDDEGRPVVFMVVVKIRTEIDEANHLGFRFDIPLAERYIERAYELRVAKARGQLGDEFTLLRAAG